MLHSRMLLYLHEVARRGSIRKAAERLNVSPTAINKQILSLEAQQGTPLFERLSRGLRLTAAGEVLVEHVRRTLRDHERAEREIAALKGMKTGEVKIATMGGLASGVLPRIVDRFLERTPHMRVTVVTAFIEEIRQRLEDGEIDLGLAYNLPFDPRIATFCSFDARLGAVVAADHPLAQHERVRVQDCLSYPIIQAAPSMVMHAAIAAMFLKADAELNPRHMTNSIEYMKAIARRGEAVAFLSPYDVEDEVRDGILAFLPVMGTSVPNTLMLVHHAQRRLSLAADMCAREIRDSLLPG
ncbi:LysR family transcriptional regulator [Sphingomonas sp.]|uniref:LysR family transcriptional regulator n=1 Tax=Sphingomonas sp. TaxID=28214 RepID=UPI0031D64E47